MRQLFNILTSNSLCKRLKNPSLYAALALIALPIMPAYAESYIFNELVVTGNERIESKSILSYANISTGDELDDADLNKAYENILATGLFETVALNPSANALEIAVVEFPTINLISFEGNARISDDILGRVIQSQSRRVYNPVTVTADAQALADSYAQQGRLAAKVLPKIIKQSNNRVDVVFEIFEGGVVEVQRIGFVGNKSFSDGRLRRVLATKQSGILHNFISSDSFVEDRIVVDRERLENFYRERGYIDVRINNVGAQFAKDRGGYFLTFNITEGRRFTIGELDVASQIDGIDVAPYIESIAAKTGKAYNPDTIDNDIARLERKALRLGHNFVRVAPKLDRDLTAQSINVTYNLTAAKKVFVERINISGNTATLDRVIRQHIKLIEGDPFNARALNEAEDRIRRLGIFKSVNTTVSEGSSVGKVIVDLAVVEQPTGSLGLGGAYSSSSGFGMFLKYSEKNFLGRGQALSFSLSNASTSKDYSLIFTEPAVMGRDVSFTSELSVKTTNQQVGNYDTEAVRIMPELQFPITDSTRLATRAGVISDKLSNLGTSANVGDAVTNDATGGGVLVGLIGYSLDYDSRRTGLEPDKGYTISLNQDLAGLSSQTQYLKTGLIAAAQTELFGKDLTVRGTIESGILSYQKGKSRITDRYFLGTSRMRGFDADGIGPREYHDNVNTALGGNKFAVLRVDAQFPLGLPNEYGITGGVFYDVGSLWDSGTTGVTVVHDKFALRQTVGASVYWTTPIGPLRFNFSHVLAKETYDRERPFELTISTQF